MEVEKRLTISVTEAAERLGVSRNLAYDAAKRGDIPTIKIGNRVLVPLAAFERLLAAGGVMNGSGGQDDVGPVR